MMDPILSLKKGFIRILIFTLMLNLLQYRPLLSISTDDLFKWTDVKELGIEGRGWKNDSLYYNRLPAKAEGGVPASVWDLSKQTVGLHIWELEYSKKTNWKRPQL